MNQCRTKRKTVHRPWRRECSLRMIGRFKTVSEELSADQSVGLQRIRSKWTRCRRFVGGGPTIMVRVREANVNPAARESTSGSVPNLRIPEITQPRAVPPMLETYVAILAASCIAVYLVLRFGLRCEPSLDNWPLYVALGLGGTPLLFNLVRKVLSGQFGADLLAGMSIATSVFLG